MVVIKILDFLVKFVSSTQNMRQTDSILRLLCPMSQSSHLMELIFTF